MAGQDRRLNTSEWQRTRRWVLARDHYECQVKGPSCTGRASQVDHIRARAHGGALLDPANLRAACVHCNASAGAQVSNERRAARAVGRRSRDW